MDLGLAGKVVLVTGGGGGAGPSIVEAFAAEGAQVAVHYRSSVDRAEAAAAAVRERGGKAIAVQADLGDRTSIDAAVAAIEQDLGRVGILVTATSAYRSATFAETSDEDWAAVVDDMLGATFRACRAVIPSMQAAGFGRIVNIASRSGLVGVTRSAHYAAAKAGIVGLTKSLAKELGPDGILANAIAPVMIQTEKDGKPTIPPDRAKEAAERTPLRRIATPADVAAVAVWLGSAANTYVTGEVISLHGGDQR
ncbi:MAG TPA: SDR family oxidoreductase [Candidatus Limnocylindrales bacterium]|nr:SDR family oxidoreductase [Candidatus Limnocylindrales bacterium]